METEDTAGGRWRVTVSVGPPTIVKWRCDVTFPDPERPFKITVGVKFNALAANGMPDMSVERQFLTGVTNDLKADLPGYGAELLLSITSQGHREWVAYAASHDWMQTWAPGFAKRWMQDRSFRIDAAKDPDWRTYRAFTRQE